MLVVLSRGTREPHQAQPPPWQLPVLQLTAKWPVLSPGVLLLLLCCLTRQRSVPPAPSSRIIRIWWPTSEA